MATVTRSFLAPGSRGFVAAVVAAQVLTQIGAFTLPALLPGYIERWALSKTEAGWLVGIFFAAYVPAVPVLLALTDRLPAQAWPGGAGATAQLIDVGVTSGAGISAASENAPALAVERST